MHKTPDTDRYGNSNAFFLTACGASTERRIFATDSSGLRSYPTAVTASLRSCQNR